MLDKRNPPRLLDHVKRISGPASYYVFEMPGSKNSIYLFGDYHFSYANQCTNCSSDDSCKPIADLIQHALKDADETQTSLDVFMEFPYVVADGDARERVLSRIDDIFRKDSRGDVKNALSKIFGKTPEYIGIFSLLYKRFSDRFYKHVPSHHNNKRFHYSDARFEFNVKRFLSPTNDKWIEMFHRRVPDVKTFRRVLEAFVLGHYRNAFQDEMYSVFGSDISVFEQSLTSKRKGGKRTLHKISKQVHKLPPTYRAKAEEYIGEKLDAICQILEEDLRYEDGVRLLTADPASMDLRDGTLVYIRASRLINYTGIFTIFMELIVQTIMMDVYLLCRMLYYASKENHGASIVYAGDYHIGVYADFLARYLKLKPLGCNAPVMPIAMDDQQVQSMVQRCVHVNLGTCDMTSVLPKHKVIRRSHR